MEEVSRATLLANSKREQPVGVVLTAEEESNAQLLTLVKNFRAEETSN